MTNQASSVPGYSLIELALVLAVSAVLVVLAIPSFAGMADHVRLIAAARALTSDLRSGRQLALSKGTSVRVVLDVAMDRYHLEYGDGNITIFKRRDFRDAGQGLHGVRIAGFSNPACGGTIAFSPRGTTSCFTTITLAVGGRTRSLTVIVTGRVRNSS